MTNEEKKHIESMSNQEKEALLKELHEKYPGINLAGLAPGENPPEHPAEEFVADWEKIKLLRELLGLPFPSEPPTKYSN